MRFNLILAARGTKNVLPCNYQYPLAAAIYKIIQQANGEYAAFLHESGYRLQSGKAFKLFTFSDIRTPFRIQGDRLMMTTNRAGMLACFHIPLAAENFIRGLFMHRQLEVADRKSRVVFEVEEVETVAVLPNDKSNEEMTGCCLKPVSPVVCGLKQESGNYRFLAPGEERYDEMLLFNWREKIRSIYGEDVSEDDLLNLKIEAGFYKGPPRSRLITIKADTPEETKIRGFMNFKINVGGKKKYMELLLNSGAGIYNSMGMGCIEE